MECRGVILVCALLVLAGCGGDGASTTVPESTTNVPERTTDRPATTTPELEPVTVTEDGASLGDVNASLVYARIGELVGVEGLDPPPVRITTQPATLNGTAPEFYRSFGHRITDDTFDETVPSGSVDTYPRLRITLRRPPNATDAQMEELLAHEFAHVYQANARWTLPANTSRFARLAVREGTAELVAWRYTERFMADYDDEATVTERFRRLGSLGRVRLGPYAYGARYARNHSDPGAPMASVYENPPTTAEQVLHGLEPGSEPPRPLDVRGGENGSWSHVAGSTERLGEARLRFVLESGLGRDLAAAAAAGWGNDFRMRFTSADDTGYAWVVRWDSADEATEFEQAFAEFRANVSEPLDLQTVGDETTVLLAGHESFVRNASVTGTAGNVTVSA